MKKLLKALAWLTGGLVLLVVAAIVIVLLVVDPNDYKDKIAIAVKDATGRDLNIVGDIGLSVFPRIALDLGELELGNAPGFSGEYFARTQKVQIRVKLMPLLDKEVEMDTVQIEGLDVHLARDESGKTNWDDLLAAANDGDSNSAQPVAALALGGINVQNASLSWTDAQAGQNVVVQALNLATGPVSFDAPLNISISFDVENIEQQMNGHIEMAGEIAYDPEAKIAAANGLTFNAVLEGPLLPGGKTDVNFTGNARFDQNNQAFALSNFNLLLPKLDLGATTGSFSIGGDIAGEPALGRFSADNLSVEGTLSGAEIPGNELAFKLACGFGLDLNEQQLELPAIQFTAAGLSGSGNISISQWLSAAPAVSGELKVATFNPRALMKVAGIKAPETTDPKALTALEFTAKLSGSGDNISLQPITMRLDDTLMKGNISVQGLLAPKLKLDLAVGTLDADRYLPPTTTTQAVNPGAAAPAATGVALGTLRALDIEARLALGKLKITGLDLDDIRVTVNAKGGVVKLSPLQANLYGGSYSGSLTLDARGEQAKISLDEKLKGVRVGQLLKAAGVDTGGMDLSDAGGDISLKSKISGDPERQTYVLKGTTVEANVTGKALPGGKLVARLSADLNIDLEQQLFVGNSVQAGVVNLKLPSGLSTTGTLAADTLQANLKSQVLSAHGLSLNLKKLLLNATAPDLPLALSAKSVEANLVKQTAQAEQFNLSVVGLNATGSVVASDLSGNPQLAGQLSLAKFNPKQVLKNLKQSAIATTDPKALTSASLKTTFKATTNSVVMDDLKLTLDETAVTGNLSVANLAARNGIRFDLKAGVLNADQYMPPGSGGQAGTPGAGAAALPLDLLRGLDAKGSLFVKKLTLSNLILTDIDVKVEGKGGVLNVNPATALLYGGSYAGNISVDARGKKGKLSVNEELKRVHIGPLLRDLNGNDRIAGRGGMTIRAQAVGSTSDELRKTLTGDASILLKDGSFKGVDVVNTLCSGIAGLLGGGGGETKFSDFQGTAKIVNGLIDNRDFVARSPLLRINGGGTYDLPSDWIKYDVEANLVASCQGQGGLGLAELGKLPPAGVRISGHPSDPKYKFDLSRMLAGLGGKGGLGDLLGIEELEGLNLPGIGGATQTTEQPTQQQTQPKKKSDVEAIEDLLKGLFN